MSRVQNPLSLPRLTLLALFCVLAHSPPMYMHVDWSFQGLSGVTEELTMQTHMLAAAATAACLSPHCRKHLPWPCSSTAAGRAVDKPSSGLGASPAALLPCSDRRPLAHTRTAHGFDYYLACMLYFMASWGTHPRSQSCDTFTWPCLRFHRQPWLRAHAALHA